jgi:hypothetical protein
MAVRSVILRVSGNVGLSDNSIRTFLGLFDQETGLVSFSIDANEAFRANYPSKKEEIEALNPYLASVFPTVGQVVPASDPVDEGLVVDSLAMVITGRVAYDDNTQKDFSYEVRDDGSVFAHEAEEGDVAWADAFGVDSTPNTAAEAILTYLYSAVGDEIAVNIAI